MHLEIRGVIYTDIVHEQAVVIVTFLKRLDPLVAEVVSTDVLHEGETLLFDLGKLVKLSWELRID